MSLPRSSTGPISAPLTLTMSLVVACGGDPKPTPVVVPPESTAPTKAANATDTSSPPPATPTPTTSSPESSSATSSPESSSATSPSAAPSTSSSSSPKTKMPALRQGSVQINGRLPNEVIIRLVRQEFRHFRDCYLKGLERKRDLEGRITTKFVIDKSGKVSMSADGGSDLPDLSVVKCVNEEFAKIVFPQPEAGVVTVVFPIIFMPGD